MKRISIIGANSFIARNFYFYLKKSKCNDIDIYLYDYQDEFEDRLYGENYQQIQLNNTNEINKINFDVDYIFFFTGKTGTVQGFSSYEVFIEVNEVFLLNFLDVYREKKSLARIIYPSTRLIYKHSEIQGVTENSETDLNSVYSITKYSAERYLELYSKVFGINYTIFRIGTPWGSIISNEGNYGTFKFFVESAKKEGKVKIYGDGKLKKTYTHIEEICELFKLIIYKNYDEMENQIFNIGGVTKSLNEIASIISKQYKCKIIHTPFPQLDYKVDGGSVILNSAKLDKIVKMNHREILFSKD